MNTIQKATQLIKEKIPDVQAIYLFGSQNTSFKNAESDIDLAIITPSRFNSVKFWSIAEEIAQQLGIDVDLINLQEASTVLRFHIISTGKRLFCNDPFFCDMFETTAYSMYEKFNDERRELLEDIKKRGQILNG